MESSQSKANQQTDSEAASTAVSDSFVDDVTTDPDFAKFQELRKAASNETDWMASEATSSDIAAGLVKDGVMQEVPDDTSSLEVDSDDEEEEQGSEEHASDPFGESDGEDGVALTTEQKSSPKLERAKAALVYYGLSEKDRVGFRPTG